MQSFQRATMAKLLRRLKIFVILFILAWSGTVGLFLGVIRCRTDIETVGALVRFGGYDIKFLFDVGVFERYWNEVIASR